jgi:hypothetical protein
MRPCLFTLTDVASCSDGPLGKVRALILSPIESYSAVVSAGSLAGDYIDEGFKCGTLAGVEWTLAVVSASGRG